MRELDELISKHLGYGKDNLPITVIAGKGHQQIEDATYCETCKEFHLIVEFKP